MDSCLVLTECLSRRILRFTTSPIDLIHSERLSSSTSSFLAHCLAYASHASMIISKFWFYENVTGSLNFGPLRNGYLSFSFCTILRSPVTTWLHGAYRNSETGQVQGRGFWERLLESIYFRLLLSLKFWEQLSEFSFRKCVVTPCFESMGDFYFGQIFDSKYCWNSKRRCPYLQILFSGMGDFLSPFNHVPWQLWKACFRKCQK